jgi:ubiquinone/menaquinone biosynthesis C-methylase UbiE
MKPDSIILDVGCGGRAAVKLLAEMVLKGKGRVCGIDHSSDMVDLSRQVNKRFIESNQVAIDHGSVSDLPYLDEMFDVVTAFETIEFWPNLSENLKEVRRVIKPGGQFLIVNRHPDQEKEDSSWKEFLQIHTSEEYRKRLGDGGYVDISIDDRSRPGWIAVLARKA